jgi:hypothetical protein
MENENKPLCNFPTDGTCLPVQALIEVKDCIVPPGSCFGVQETIVDKHGHEVEAEWKQDAHGDWVPMSDECDHKDTPEYIAEHAKDKILKQHKMTKYTQPVLLDTNTEIATSIEVQTVAVVEHPHVDIKPPPKPPMSLEAALPMLSGAIAGVVSSVGGPMLMNLLKNFLKNKFKKGGDSSQKEEEKQDEPTDCKTHQLKSNAKLVAISKRITALEGKIGNIPVKTEEEEEGFSFGAEDFEDFKDRIEKLEKMLAKKKS